MCSCCAALLSTPPSLKPRLLLLCDGFGTVLWFKYRNKNKTKQKQKTNARNKQKHFSVSICSKQYITAFVFQHNTEGPSASQPGRGVSSTPRAAGQPAGDSGGGGGGAFACDCGDGCEKKVLMMNALFQHQEQLQCSPIRPKTQPQRTMLNL